MAYTLYIDESGDEGIEKKQINNGASPLFFLGAYLVDENNKEQLELKIEECKIKLNNIALIHFNKLRHEQKVFFCSNIAQLPIVAFGLISDKSELDRGGYRERISGETYKFYNKNVKYLLETIGKYCQREQITIERIVFEKQDNKDYSKLRNYIRTIQETPHHTRAQYLSDIDASSIESVSKNEDPLLQISDALANSLFRLCIPNSLDTCEPRYVEELKNIIASDANSVILNHGIKIVPNLCSLRIKTTIKDYLKELTSDEAIRF